MLFEKTVLGTDLESVVSFGDYTAVSPLFQHLNKGGGAYTPTIRQASGHIWHVERGNTVSPTRPAERQFRQLAERLVARKHYRGPNFSRADALLYKIANGEIESKDRQFFTQIAIEHHIAETLQMLAA
jgi:hypothetical protein